MNKRAFLTQKIKEKSELKDSESDFGVVVLDVSFPDFEVKEPQSNNYNDESGDDSFIPKCLKEKGYDFHINAGYSGNVDDWETNMDSFLDYLTGYDNTGVEMLVYMCNHRIGRKCRFIKMSRPMPFVDKDTIVLEFEIHFHVDEPRTRVELIKDLEGEVIELRERKR